MTDSHIWSLFSESNFDAYDRARYPEILSAGLAQLGLDSEDVLAVTQDGGVWAICKQGVFRAYRHGVFKKRIQAEALIPYSKIEEARVEPSGPRSGKIVLTDVSGGKLAEIEFAAGGPDRTIEGEQAQCERVLRIMEAAWRQAPDGSG